MKKILFFAIAVTAVFSAFKGKEKPYGMFKGDVVTLGNGKAWSWVKVGKNNKPESVGITLTKDALTNLPAGGGHHDHGVAYLLKLPSQKKVTPFDHVGMDWNPNGHEPGPIYGKPHFDFHFYMMPAAERLAIQSYEQDSVKFNNTPAADYFPPTYINVHHGIAQMGSHWVDVTSPELSQTNPAPFTETIIYGSFDGKVTFVEPMITKKFLEESNGYERNIPQPAKVQKSGYYPTKMRIQKSNDEINIILDSFVYRTKS